MKTNMVLVVAVLLGCDASPDSQGFGAPGPAAQRGDVAGVGGAATAAAGGRSGTAGAGAGGALADAGTPPGAGGAPSVADGAAPPGGWTALASDPLPCSVLGWNPTTFNVCSSTRADGRTEYRYTADGRLCGACLPTRPAGVAGACLTSSAPIGYCVATSCAECPIAVIGEDGAGPLSRCSSPTNVTPCNSSALTSARQTCSTCTTTSLPAANQVGCLLSPIAVCSLTCQECWNL